MPSSERITVLGADGWRGTIPVPTQRWHDTDQVTILLDNGQQIIVPANTLVPQIDGSYRAMIRLSDLQQATQMTEERLIIPIIQETVHIHKEVVETGRVRIAKVVQERQEVINTPLFAEEVEVTRVPVNQLLEGPADMRMEGDTLIIPLVEEVLVVEKRLMLKEEVRVTRQRRQLEQAPQQVTLRREDVQIDRIPTNNEVARHDDQQSL